MDATGMWVMFLVQALLAGLSGLLLLSFKALYRTSDERLRRVEDGIDDIRRDYVRKEEFVRSDAVYRNKLDTVARDVSELKGQEGVTAELVTALAAHLRQSDKQP